MVLDSPFFLAFTGTGLLAFWLTPARWWALVVLPILNLVFILFVAEPVQLFYLAIFLLTGFVLVQLVHAQKQVWIFWTVTGFLLFAFLYLRRYTFSTFLPYPENMPFIIGLSYVFFRVMQLVIDTGNGDIREKLGPIKYFNFTCLFPMFLSGPIQRYQDYDRQERSLEEFRPDDTAALDASFRIIMGYVKAGLLSDVFLQMHEKFLSKLDSNLFDNSLESGLVVTGTASLYTVFLYLNFSGYTDIVIGIGRLFGFRLPENFNKPFEAENFIDLWQRWHMSLANWMKFYVFNPVLKFLTRRVREPSYGPYLSVAAFFVTFALLGAWHGPTAPFLLCGLMLGLGMSVNKLYQEVLKKHWGKERLKNLQSFWLYRQACFGLTFMWLTYSTIGFWADWEEIKQYSGLLQGMGIFLVFALTVVLAASARVAFRICGGPYFALCSRLAGVRVFEIVALWLLLLVLYFYYFFWRTEVVEFIYKGF